MTPTGFEPVLPPWKGGVLTAWPRGQMAPQVGFEPTTARLTAECSTTELLRNNDIAGKKPIKFFGAGEGNRTLIISLEGWGFTTKLHPHRVYGAADGNRTHECRNHNPMR